jgi:hypothetical protein
MMKSNHLVASFLYTHADVLIKIVFDAEPRPDIPQIYIRIKRTDMVYVLQVKVESALANVAPRYAVSADELELEHKGQRLKETRALDFYSITEGSEVVACADTHFPEPPYCTYRLSVPASCAPYVPEVQDSLPVGATTKRTSPGRAVHTAYRGNPGGRFLLCRAERAGTCRRAAGLHVPRPAGPGHTGRALLRHGQDDHLAVRLPLPGMLASNPNPKPNPNHGFHCEVCWRRRWFRCEVLRVYPTSLLVAYLDWTEVEWPHF